MMVSYNFQLTFDALNSRLFPVSVTENETLVPVNNIIEKCIFVKVENTCYIARFNQLLLD